ncbi:hypothetical protein IVB03_09275 [Bradyrhizobium sp. 168]|uniref:hypothetical protein n=1 Tax=Bradyrhizobium sp. 168 TaxID=2782639 RepID=UPI001FFC1D38|nr:hypothetical protein [Bradyrhizobium sp. 168]MCK1579756.1 hypothetical protein [Bradyrhizobium sp. 168]
MRRKIHPIATKAMGIDIALYKSSTFLGALHGGALTSIAVQFTTFLSLSLPIGIVVGGAGSATFS